MIGATILVLALISGGFVLGAGVVLMARRDAEVDAYTMGLEDGKRIGREQLWEPGEHRGRPAA